MHSRHNDNEASKAPSHCSVFIATSLDGFIAREDGSIDWLMQANARVPAGEDCGYAAHMSRIDALVMGRQTVEQVLGFDSWPYEERHHVYVLSRSLAALPPGTPASVSLHAGPPQALLAQARERGHRSLYVDGGQTIQAFLAEDLIDELTITTIPVLLGRGRPLFGPLGARPEQWLQHVETRAYPFGFVQSRYRRTAER